MISRDKYLIGDSKVSPDRMLIGDFLKITKVSNRPHYCTILLRFLGYLYAIGFLS